MTSSARWREVLGQLTNSFLIGFGFSYGNVIWGTLLQRRVPRHMLGRISSLDFFVSLALMLSLPGATWLRLFAWMGVGGGDLLRVWLPAQPSGAQRTAA